MTVPDLALRKGNVPQWMFNRMVRAASPMVDAIIEENGVEGFLRTLSDPLGFQLLTAALGFEDGSSGSTTVTCGVLKRVIDGRRDVMAAGRKKRAALRVPDEVHELADMRGIPEDVEARMLEASRMTAKVDGAAVQDGHDIYHHALFFDADGHWAVVQQGMSESQGTARRYQWSSQTLRRYVEEPHTAILGIRAETALD